MVRVGFVCEGITDAYFLNSEDFRQILSDLNIQSLGVKDISGSGNMLPHKLKTQLALFFRQGAEYVIILTDLDKDKCITITKERITANDGQITIIAVRELESWLLADVKNMSDFLENEYHIEFPEQLSNPKKEMMELVRNKFSKRILTETKVFFRLIDNGFSLTQAASHPNCPSANYFLTKLEQLSPQ